MVVDARRKIGLWSVLRLCKKRAIVCNFAAVLNFLAKFRKVLRLRAHRRGLIGVRQMAASTASTTGQIKAAQNADKVHSWPKSGAADFSKDDAAMYVNLQRQRAHSDWTPIDLVELSRVSMLIVDAIGEHEDLRDEGFVVRGGKNGQTLIENPRNRVLSTLNATISASLRRLGITHTSEADKRSRANRGKAERDQRETRTAGGYSDDLLN